MLIKYKVGVMSLAVLVKIDFNQSGHVLMSDITHVTGNVHSFEI